MENAMNISVIIPTYNRSDTIERCLDSILKQKCQPYEIIVVDDASIDDTIDKITKYKEPKIRYVKLKKKSGAQAARNRGIKEAKSEWIAFLDSDDEWLEAYLERQYRTLQQYNFNPFVVIYTDGFWIDHTNNILDFKVPKISSDISYKELLRAPGPMFQGILVSRVALNKIGLLDEKVPSFQEWDTSLMLSKYCKFVYVNEKLFKYHIHKRKAISKDKKLDILGYEYIMNKHKGDLKKYKLWEGHVVRQIYRSLELKLWADTDRYLIKLKIRNIRLLLIFFLYSLYRILHLQPSKMRKLLQGKRQALT